MVAAVSPVVEGTFAGIAGPFHFDGVMVFFHGSECDFL